MEENQRHNRKGQTTNNRRLREETRQKTISDSAPTNYPSRISDYYNILTGTTTSKTKKRRFQKRTSIVNLSNYTLTKAETRILEKGLNFIPTPNREHEARIVQDFLLFERKLRLHHKLHTEENQEQPATDNDLDEEPEEESPHKLLRPSKGYKPEDHEMDPNIMRYKTTVLNEMKIELGNRRNPRFNTTKQERKAMKSLKKNQDIIIKPADKGGAIVILNKEDYIKEGMRQLSNTNHYKELEEPEKTIKRFI